MKLRNLVIFAALVLCVSAMGQGAKAVFVKKYATIAKLIKAKDKAGLTAFFTKNFTSDFVYTGSGPGETNNRAQFIQHLEQGISMMQTVTVAEATVSDVKVRGKMGTLIAKIHLTMLTPPMSGKQHKIDATDIQATTYRKVGMDWKVSKIVVTKSTVTMDGKKMPVGKVTKAMKN